MFLSSERSWSPQMDIYETPEEIIVLAEIAGVDKDDLEVEINTKAVRISGCRSELPRTGNATFRLAEIQYGPFERILFLPAPHRHGGGLILLHQRISSTTARQTAVGNQPQNSHFRRVGPIRPLDRFFPYAPAEDAWR